MFRSHNVMRRAGLLLASALVISISGCTKAPPIAEIDVSLGQRLDGDTRYYAYYVGLKPTNPDSISMSLATEDEIAGALQVLRDPLEKMYAAVAYDPPRVYLRPASLTSIFSDEAPASSKMEDVGYFMTLLQSNVVLGNYRADLSLIEGDEPAIAGGLSWTQPTSGLLELVEELRGEWRIVAAEQGAEGVERIAVFRSTDPTPWGGAGIYATGRAVVSVPESNQHP